MLAATSAHGWQPSGARAGYCPAMPGTWTYRLLPGRCVLCLDASQRPLDLCRPCENELPYIGDRHCQRCGLVTAVATDRCGACIHAPPPYASSVSLLDYVFPAREMILRFKQGHMAMGATLSQLLAERHYWQGDLIVPVPIHRKRRRQRGFNQAELIASTLAAHWALPMMPQAVRQTRPSAAQKGLGRSQRLTNVAHVFSADVDFDGRHLLLVDDVITTGATLTALTAVMLARGASRVDTISLARAPALTHR